MFQNNHKSATCKIGCLVIKSKLVVLLEFSCILTWVAYRPNCIYLLFVSAPPLGPSGLSGRSSVSSLASSSSMGSHHHQQSLNQALAIVANKWDREQRRQEQEVTRKLTLLKQRKVSAVLKVSAPSNPKDL